LHALGIFTTQHQTFAEVKRMIDVFTIVRQTSNHHIQLVMNNLSLNFSITWLWRNLGFWLTQRFLRLVH